MTIKLQKISFITFLLMVLSLYLYAIVLQLTIEGNIFLSDPKDLPYSIWGQINFLLILIILPLILALSIILLISRFNRMGFARVVFITTVFVCIYMVDPFGIINWILD